jgi:hypothetical protein
VHTAEDVASAFTGLSAAIRDQIIPFFDQHNGIADAVTDRHPGIDVTQDPSGAMHAV